MFKTVSYCVYEMCMLFMSETEQGHVINKVLDGVFLQAGANPNEFDNAMMTPLMVAAENGHVDVIDLLLAGGAYAHTKVL